MISLLIGRLLSRDKNTGYLLDRLKHPQHVISWPESIPNRSDAITVPQQPFLGNVLSILCFSHSSRAKQNKPILYHVTMSLPIRTRVMSRDMTYHHVPGLILALHCAAYLTMCCKIPFVCFKPPLYNLISCNLLCNLLCLLKLFAVSLLTTNFFVVCWESFNFYLPGILIILVFCKEVVGWSTVYKSYRVLTIQYI